MGLWSEHDFVAFDIETTGRYPLTAEICEMAAVRWRRGKIISRWSTLIKPSRPMSPENVAIHGISNAMVENAPPLSEKIAECHAALNGAIGVAHHAPFDMGFLSLEFERAGLGLPASPALCSSLLARKLILESANHRLQTLIAHLGLAQGAAHRAQDDAEACLGVALHCFARLGSDSALESAFAAQGGALAWERFSLQELAGHDFAPLLIRASAEQSIVELVYAGGSSPGQARRVHPEGFVRSLDGDYVVAYCEKDQKAKRYFLDKVISARIV